MVDFEQEGLVGLDDEGAVGHRRAPWRGTAARGGSVRGRGGYGRDLPVSHGWGCGTGHGEERAGGGVCSLAGFDVRTPGGKEVSYVRQFFHVRTVSATSDFRSRRGAAWHVHHAAGRKPRGGATRPGPA